MVGPAAIGAIPLGTGTTFRTWAKGRLSVKVHIDGRPAIDMEPDRNGYFCAYVDDVTLGSHYRFCIDGREPVPDLASRWQPEGAKGPSEVVGNDFDWTDQSWAGVDRFDQVIYELHVGTFTPDGTWAAAKAKLASLHKLGITVIQLMPVGTFGGSFGWGYDTILPYAPFPLYGTPDDMRSFVNAAHGWGIGVILDVVYNHAGLGELYSAYSDHYFTKRHANEWGPSFNFDDENARAVRDFMVGNAVYWIEDFHLDGLRIDAVQAMLDTSDLHIVAELTEAVRRAGGRRDTYVLVENQPQERRMIDPCETGGNGVDAMYSDDFQHAARVAVTGHNDFYYRDYNGTPQELVSALKYGFLYQGQRSDMRNAAYGTYNLDTPSERFVHFLENHDQVANSARGFRLSSLMSPARLRAITSLLLLGPQTPALFQGQEFGATNPFHYFFGVTGDDANAVAEGRKASLANFPSVTDPVMLERLPDPTAASTFVGSKLDWVEVDRHAGLLKLHSDLLALRRRDRAFSQLAERRVDGAVIGEAGVLLRFLTPDPLRHRLMLVNFGRDLHMGVTPEPLLAPPKECRWTCAWSSEHPDYDGGGRAPVDTTGFWILPADSAILFSAESAGDDRTRRP